MNATYKPTIGLEIHAELKTRGKMFCACKNDPDEKKPNLNICPVCVAYPGTLPVINKEALKSVLKIGVAVNGMIADFTEFDRKNYFYPDIPKNYQISQYKFPLVSGGELSGVLITRVHLEEDTARSSHDKGEFSLIDYNRAGVPLMELVTEPVIHDAETAVKFAKEFQLLLRALKVGEANMEKGEMRVEANISVSKDSKKMGTKVEVKNLNSFRVVGKAIEYEIKRQIELLESGEEVVQETRGFDETKQETFSQRKKESSHDYRYFPDPDLPKLYINEIPAFSIENLQKEMGELPSVKRERFINDYGIKKEDADMYVSDFLFGKLFDKVADILNDKEKIKIASNYISSDLAGLVRVFGEYPRHIFEDIEPASEAIAKLVNMIYNDKISSRAAKDILAVIFKTGGSPETIADELGLMQKSDKEELKKIVKSIIEQNNKAVLQYKGGSENALQFLVGQTMKETHGSANPKILQTLIKEMLG
ncbi:MAG: Asp-tRNA(Asn)/Glu-tRNA(Gln) amidotransferase subunit GatB [Patescibacteria group bacterium]